MEKQLAEKTPRIEVVDALRGFAVMAILLVHNLEHFILQNARKALQIADRAYVLETGKITLSGTGAELASSDAVKKAYLGG